MRTELQLRRLKTSIKMLELAIALLLLQKKCMKEIQ